MGKHGVGTASSEAEQKICPARAMAEGGACYKENNEQLSLSTHVLTCDYYLHLRKYFCIKGLCLALAGHVTLTDYAEPYSARTRQLQ